MGESDQTSRCHRKIPSGGSPIRDTRLRNDLATEKRSETIGWTTGARRQRAGQARPVTFQADGIQPDVIVYPEAHAVPAKGNGEIKAFLIRTLPERHGSARWCGRQPPSCITDGAEPEDPAAPHSWVLSGLRALSISASGVPEGLPLELLANSTERHSPRLRRLHGCSDTKRSMPEPRRWTSDSTIGEADSGRGNLRIEVHYTWNGNNRPDEDRFSWRRAAAEEISDDRAEVTGECAGGYRRRR